MNGIKNLLELLITRAVTFGLEEVDVNHAREYLRYYEWGLSFEHVITQLYEYDRTIDPEFYDLIERVGNKMKLPAEQYEFMRAYIQKL